MWLQRELRGGRTTVLCEMARNFSKPDIVTEESENEIENGGDVVDPNEPRTQISDLKLPETTVIKMMKEMVRSIGRDVDSNDYLVRVYH